jgi:DNA excision repair protein ERCC-2
MCIHPDVVEESDRERVDAACRSMTASWVRNRAEQGHTVKLCDFFEGYQKAGSEGGDGAGGGAGLRGIYTLEDLRKLGRERGWCPYFTARQVIAQSTVVVYNYQYLLDPKIAGIVSKEMEDKSIVVFDEAHNIDNVCIESLSVSLDRPVLESAEQNLGRLGAEVRSMKQADAARLQAEYQRLLGGLGGGIGGVGAGAGTGAGAGAGAGRVNGGEEMPAAPVLPSDVLQEAIPGSIRNAELFLQMMKLVVRHLWGHIRVPNVRAETPAKLLHDMSGKLSIDVKPLRFAYSRLNSLLRTLQITDMDTFGPLTLVADFVTLLATYQNGFMVITEPHAPKTPYIPEPVMQLACLDASIAVKPVFDKFQSVILTSGTLSPLDMYPKMLNFNPVVRESLEMSVVRRCICPMVVSKGSDQTAMTTRFENRDDPSVIRNYGMLLVQLASVTPDGIVAFFPSYSYMESIVAAWHAAGIIRQLETHKLLFLETKDIVETTLSLNNFKRACDVGRGAIFLSIARGKVAEGIDFDRHYGRCVVLFGIPYQYTLSNVLRARLAYLRDTYQIREQDFLTFDALRQSSQCIGRIIRSKRDYGLIVFADKRYATQSKRSKLPHWVQQFMPDANLNLSTDLAIVLARSFLKELAQPAPPEPQGLDPKSKILLSEEDIRQISAMAADDGANGAEGKEAGKETGLLGGSGSLRGAALDRSQTSGIVPKAASSMLPAPVSAEEALLEAMEAGPGELAAFAEAEAESLARAARAAAGVVSGPAVRKAGLAGFADSLETAQRFYASDTAAAMEVTADEGGFLAQVQESHTSVQMELHQQLLAGNGMTGRKRPREDEAEEDGA